MNFYKEENKSVSPLAKNQKIKNNKKVAIQIAIIWNKALNCNCLRKIKIVIILIFNLKSLKFQMKVINKMRYSKYNNNNKQYKKNHLIITNNERGTIIF